MALAEMLKLRKSILISSEINKRNPFGVAVAVAENTRGIWTQIF